MTRAVSSAVLLTGVLVAAGAAQPERVAEPGPAPRAANPDGSFPPVPGPVDPAETVDRIVRNSGEIAGRLAQQDTGAATRKTQGDTLALIDTLLQKDQEKDKNKDDKDKQKDKKDDKDKQKDKKDDKDKGDGKDPDKDKEKSKDKGSEGPPDMKDPMKGKGAEGMPPPKPDGMGKDAPKPKDDPGMGQKAKADPKPEPGPEPKVKDDPRDRDPLQANFRPRTGPKPAGPEPDKQPGKDPGPAGVAQGPKDPAKAAGPDPGGDVKGALAVRPAMPLDASIFDRKEWGRLRAVQRAGGTQYDESQFMDRYRDLLKRYYDTGPDPAGTPDR